MKEDDRGALARIFGEKDYVLAAVVFGSYARGDVRTDSDLDVAVLPRKRLDERQHVELVESLAMQFGRPIDIVDLAAVHGPIARIALTQGDLVFCRDRRAYAERLRRMLYDQADWIPAVLSANSLAIRKWLTETSSSPRSRP